MASLKQIESDDIETKDSSDTLYSILDQQGKDISTLGKPLQQTNAKANKVCDMHITMNQMDGSLSALLQQVSLLN